jgi:hypothetical protein
VGERGRRTLEFYWVLLEYAAILVALVGTVVQAGTPTSKKAILISFVKGGIKFSQFAKEENVNLLQDF